MEMDTQFVVSRQAVEKQVHQPGFAASHTTPQVQAGNGFTSFATDFCPPARDPVGAQFNPDTVQFFNCFALRRISFIATVGDQVLINGEGSALQVSGAA